MSSDSEALTDVGRQFVIKLARVVPGAVCYGIYLVLMLLVISIFIRHGRRMRGLYFIVPVTVFMFLGGTLFLYIDAYDFSRRVLIILVDNPSKNVQERLGQADSSLIKLFWTGQMLFLTMLLLSDSIVVWRTWAIYNGDRRWVALPIATWLGAAISAVFELGCEVHTGWGISSLSPSASPVGHKTCADADRSSYALSFVTNIFCTSMISYKTWQHRKVMSKYLGSARRKTQVEKVLTLLIESGFIYLIIYSLKAVPVYRPTLTRAELMVFNVIDAVIQQAMGMYPTAIIVLVQMEKSLWDTAEVSQNVSASKNGITFAHSSTTNSSTINGTFTTQFSNDTGPTIAMGIAVR